MLAFTAKNFNEAYPYMIQAVMTNGREIGSRVSGVKEIAPVMVEVLEPQRRLVTAAGRPINVAFALAEVLWILQGRQDVEMVEAYNTQISQYSDDGWRFNAAYGHRLRAAFGHDQLLDVEDTLRTSHESRQATLVLSDPSRDRGRWDDGGLNTTKDRACNVLAHLLIRDGALDWLQVVRSNDAMWGTPYNWMQFTHLQEFLATRLGVGMGKYTHVVDSLHIYDYHWSEAAAVEGYDLYDITGADHKPMEDCSDAVMDRVYKCEKGIRANTVVPPGEIPDYWMGVLYILMAHKYYTAKEDQRCLASLIEASKIDPIYAIAQARFYYDKRWHKEEYNGVEDFIFHNFGPDAGTWIVSRVEATVNG